MKRMLINTFVIAAIIAGVVSCKGEKEEKKTETEVTTVEEVKEEKIKSATTKYKVDTANSVINWVGSKPGEKHTGTLNLSSGVMKIGESISGTFLIDMNSLTVTDLTAEKGKANLEGHLKGSAKANQDHFFNVAKFPTAAFEVTGVSEKDGKKMMEGNLTIRGIKKNISFSFSYGTGIDGSVLELKSEPFTINRTDWGVNYGSKSIFNDLGDKFISDDIELTIMIKANKA